MYFTTKGKHRANIKDKIHQCPMETLVFCLLSFGTGNCNILILKSSTLQNASEGSDWVIFLSVSALRWIVGLKPTHEQRGACSCILKVALFLSSSETRRVWCRYLGSLCVNYLGINWVNLNFKPLWKRIVTGSVEPAEATAKGQAGRKQLPDGLGHGASQ